MSAMTNQPPKDFLALSHGHEWVNFYESFDKLVQDHLSRSSELLRKAMSLPEVADREVAQIRDDLEMQLKSERERNHATLSVLQDEIGKSRENVSVLAALASGLLAEFDNLSSSVNAAIAQATAAAEAAPVDGFVDMPSGEGESKVSAGAGEGDDPVEAEGAGTELSAEADAAWEQLAEEVDASSDSAEESEIDLNALAEAEQMGDGSDSGEDAVAADSGERTRPHWLNMARSNGNSN
jgi:hypothetical protein